MFPEINWNPTTKDLRKFGMAILIGFGLIGALFYWKNFQRASSFLWLISVGVPFLAFFLPSFSKPFYYVWMGLAFVMGTILSNLILLIIFYLVITPTGLVMKLIGRDELRLKKSSYRDNTYWINHDKIDNKDYYERLF